MAASYLHEGPVALFRERPVVLLDLLHSAHGIELARADGHASGALDRAEVARDRLAEPSLIGHRRAQGGAAHKPRSTGFAERIRTIRDEYGAQNFGALRRVSLMMLQRDATLKRGIAASRAKAARNTDYLEHVLTLEIP